MARFWEYFEDKANKDVKIEWVCDLRGSVKAWAPGRTRLLFKKMGKHLGGVGLGEQEFGLGQGKLDSH